MKSSQKTERECVAACNDCEEVDPEGPVIATAYGDLPVRVLPRVVKHGQEKLCRYCKWGEIRQTLLEAVSIAA